MVLAEAAAELQSQLGAYGILRESARAAAAGAGEGGALAADNLGSAFDAEAAAAVLMGDVTIDLTPEEVVLGVIPLLSMALFVWFREHHPETSAGSNLAALAHALDLFPRGSFALRGVWPTSCWPTTTLRRSARTLILTSSSMASSRLLAPPSPLTMAPRQSLKGIAAYIYTLRVRH